MNQDTDTRRVHLAGIVPVSGHSEESFGFPWHKSLQPIEKAYTAVERSIVECAYAGCDTIWVVCDDNIQPLIKKILGDYIENPYCLEKHLYVKYPSEHRKQIPIFYTPIHPKDRDRRDSYGWSVLHGVLTSFIVSTKISKWLTPTKYYVSFPYGVYKPDELRKYRSELTSKESFYLSYKGKTVADGEYLGFTMSAKEYKEYVWNIKNNCSGGSRNIPLHERWSSKHFSLDKIFGCAIINEKNKREVNWYYKIDDWKSYKTYMSSDESSTLLKPSESMFSYHEYSKMKYGE